MENKQSDPYTLRLMGKWEKEIEITVLDAAYSIQEVIDLIQADETRFNPIEMMPQQPKHWSGLVKLGGKVIAEYRIIELDGYFDEIEWVTDPEDEEIDVRLDRELMP